LPDSSVLSPDELSAIIGEAIKSRRDADKFNAKLREIDEKVKDPIDRARLKFELLVKVAVEAFGADPAVFDDVARLVMLGPMLKALGQDLAEFGLVEEIAGERRKAIVKACYAVRRFLTYAGQLLPGYGPAGLRPFGWIMEAQLPRKMTARQGRVCEALALSTWYFHNRNRGASLDEAARHVRLKLQARGVKRTKEELIRYRDDIDCDNHDRAARAAPAASDHAAAAAKLKRWAISPPAKHPTRINRKTTDKARQSIYETQWPIVEALVETVGVDGAIEVLLDQIKPRPIKPGRHTVFLHPQAD